MSRIRFLDFEDEHRTDDDEEDDDEWDDPEWDDLYEESVEETRRLRLRRSERKSKSDGGY
jgi:hypothetical protein